MTDVIEIKAFNKGETKDFRETDREWLECYGNKSTKKGIELAKFLAKHCSKGFLIGLQVELIENY